MAGTVMHLVIADRLLEKLAIQNPAMFYCGNLAPDAIMARENYVRKMKNHTHFKDGQRPYDFRRPECQGPYREKLLAFARHFLLPEDPSYELYLGYIVHMFVDELYLLEYYEDFVVELERQQLHPSDKAFTQTYVGDVDLVDWELVRTYPFSHPMPEVLRQLSGYDIPGWITADEIERSKAFIIQKNFETQHERLPLQVMEYQKNYDFMDLCVARIPSMLRDLWDKIKR